MWKPTAFLTAALLTTAAGPAAAGGASPTVVELFTSQGCYSCPPAEAYLTELADRKDLVALEWHVDYWDDLVYGFAGKWKDPFSSPEYTRRQQVYNAAIRGQNGVYTPQMVIDGRFEAVGSRRGDVAVAIQRAMNEAPNRLRVSIRRDSQGALKVDLKGAERTPAEVWLVRYDHAHTTVVRSGENKGKTLTSRNIVRATQKLGDWRGRAASYDVAELKLGPNQGCAVLVQSLKRSIPGPILAAANCPVN
ncbi:MAG: DUF1223 domain-containing protein [Magnetovibrio sp.]|nr:DUF1223 domain-containing protein [Magnetovibrio sp.]